MSQERTKKTDCNGCRSKLKISDTILCVEMEIEPDQPMGGCELRGKGRAACDLSLKERQELEEIYKQPSPTYY